MITIIQADGVAERRQIDAMRARAAEKNADIERAVQAILEDVRRGKRQTQCCSIRSLR